MNIAASMMSTDFTKNENFDMSNGNDLNGQYDNGQNGDDGNNGNTQDDQDQNGNYDNNGNVNDGDDNQNNNNDGNPTEPEQFRKVFIGGLSYKTDDDTLKNYFAKYGNLVDHVVMKDGTSGRSRGFGFVTYSCSSMVDELMKNRPHIIDGRQVEPKRATPREDSGKTEVQMTVKKLFIGGLRDNLTEDDLKNYFNSYGNVIEAVVMKEKETSKSRGFGFVTFDDYDPVDKIILEKHHSINGVNIHTQKALPKDYEKGQGGGNGGGGGGNRQGNFRNNDGNGFGNGNFGNGGGNFNGGGGGFNNFGGRGGGNGGGFQRNNSNGGNFNGGGMGNSSLNNTYGNYNTAQNKMKNDGMGGMGMGMGNGGGMGGGGNRGNNRGGGPMRRGGGGNRSGPYGNGGGFNNGGNNNNFNNNRGNRGGRGGVGQRGGRGGGQGGGNDNNMPMN